MVAMMWGGGPSRTQVSEKKAHCGNRCHQGIISNSSGIEGFFLQSLLPLGKLSVHTLHRFCSRHHCHTQCFLARTLELSMLMYVGG